MTETLREMLPAIYGALLPPFFDTVAPEETKATCASCAMCPTAERPAAPGVVFFRPDTKCCTYHPRLPSYLVGAILRDERADMSEGRRRVRARIASRVGVTPRWLAPPKKYGLLLEASREASFGRSRALLCPYYEDEGGLCTIWRHREADCSTFFCKYVAGADGRTFWRSLGGYLRLVERRLTELAVGSVAPELVEPPPGPAGALSIDELEERPPDGYASTWGAWTGREEELYLACYDAVSALGAADLQRAVGAGAPELATMIASHRQATAPQLPERLMLAPDASLQPGPDGVLCTTYSKYEPVLLTHDLHEVLGELGPNETVAEVRARLLRDAGIDVPEAMLLALHQLRVLVPPPGGR